MPFMRCFISYKRKPARFYANFFLTFAGFIRRLLSHKNRIRCIKRNFRLWDHNTKRAVWCQGFLARKRRFAAFFPSFLRKSVGYSLAHFLYSSVSSVSPWQRNSACLPNSPPVQAILRNNEHAPDYQNVYLVCIVQRPTIQR